MNLSLAHITTRDSHTHERLALGSPKFVHCLFRRPGLQDQLTSVKQVCSAGWGGGHVGSASQAPGGCVLGAHDWLPGFKDTAVPPPAESPPTSSGADPGGQFSPAWLSGASASQRKASRQAPRMTL